MFGDEPVMEDSSTILIVDDEKIGRDVLKGLLIKQGYRLAFAESGQEALDKAHELTPDLILLDVMMPNMDGFEVCRQEGVIQRLGSNDDIEVDVRVIVATHEYLTGLIEKGEFREDLYYRLKVFQLELPPLRERKSDIPLLINHFIAHYNERLGKQIKSIDASALDILYHYSYPGNIRELQHIIESAMILCQGD